MQLQGMLCIWKSTHNNIMRDIRVLLFKIISIFLISAQEKMSVKSTTYLF